MKRAAKVTPNRLRKYRLIMGYDQTEVAFLLGLKSHARISEWEQGTAKPSLDNLIQLSIIYRTLADELYYDLRHEFMHELMKREQLLHVKREESG